MARSKKAKKPKGPKKKKKVGPEGNGLLARECKNWKEFEESFSIRKLYEVGQELEEDVRVVVEVTPDGISSAESMQVKGTVQTEADAAYFQTPGFGRRIFRRSVGDILNVFPNRVTFDGRDWEFTTDETYNIKSLLKKKAEQNFLPVRTQPVKARGQVVVTSIAPFAPDFQEFSDMKRVVEPKHWARRLRVREIPKEYGYSFNMPRDKVGRRVCLWSVGRSKTLFADTPITEGSYGSTYVSLDDKQCHWGRNIPVPAGYPPYISIRDPHQAVSQGSHPHSSYSSSLGTTSAVRMKISREYLLPESKFRERFWKLILKRDAEKINTEANRASALKITFEHLSTDTTQNQYRGYSYNDRYRKREWAKGIGDARNGDTVDGKPKAESFKLRWIKTFLLTSHMPNSILLQVIREHDVELLQFVLKAFELDVTLLNEYELDPRLSFVEALAKWDRVDQLKLLVTKGLELTGKSSNGDRTYSPLHHAIEFSASREMVELLLSAQDLPRLRESRTVIQDMKRIQGFRALSVEERKDLRLSNDYVRTQDIANLKDHDRGMTPLGLAVTSNNATAVRALLGPLGGARVDEPAWEGETALGLGLQMGTTKEIVNLLVRAGADLDRKNLDGRNVEDAMEDG